MSPGVTGGLHDRFDTIASHLDHLLISLLMQT